ncbi:MAG: hypothetical protein J6D47_04395 [Peptostreptococcaceae bacterium]|nr:hypothetical protein [Peptostreptococcaceae bacterium]
MKYYMKSRFFSLKEDFWIKNEYGEDTFFVDKKFLSLGLQFDMIKNNEILYSVKEKLLTFLSNYEIYNSIEVVAKVNQKLTFMRDKIKVDSKYGEFTIQGNLFDYSYRIYKDNIFVAKIEKEIFAFTDNYEVDIDFEDEAFILTLVVIIDNIIDKQKD